MTRPHVTVNLHPRRIPRVCPLQITALAVVCLALSFDEERVSLELVLFIPEFILHSSWVEAVFCTVFRESSCLAVVSWILKLVVQLLICVWLFVTPQTAAHQASLSITISQSLLKPLYIESVMPSNHLILCCPLLLPSILVEICSILKTRSLAFPGGSVVKKSPTQTGDTGWFPDPGRSHTACSR